MDLQPWPYISGIVGFPRGKAGARLQRSLMKTWKNPRKEAFALLWPKKMAFRITKGHLLELVRK